MGLLFLPVHYRKSCGGAKFEGTGAVTGSATKLCLSLAAGSLGCLSRAIMPIRALCTICSDFFDHSRDVAAIHCGHTFHLQW